MKRLYCPVTRAIQWRVIGMGGEDGRDIAVTRTTQGRMIGISGGDDYGGGEFSLDERYGINAKKVCNR